MQKSLSLVSVLVALVVCTGIAVAQEEREMTGTVTGVVTEVDPTAHTFTVMIQGKAITFSTALPTIGESIDIAFSWKPGGPLVARSMAQSSSEVEMRASDFHHCRAKGNPFYSLRLRDCSGF